MTRHGAGRRYLRALLLALLLLFLLPVLLLTGLYVTGGYVKTPTSWWYPFVTSLWSDYYTTGPFAMTSNTREDNPVWQELPPFNRHLARLTYAMSRGQAEADVAWLLAQGEWPDQAALGPGIAPNSGESAMSRALVRSGLIYDRISRGDLTGATVQDGRLVVGNASYRALLVDDLEIAQPALLDNILAIARSGIPIVWRGPLPRRAPGMAGQPQRDLAVGALAAQMDTTVSRVDTVDDVAASLVASGAGSALRPLTSADLMLRINHRVLSNAELFLLFNETDAQLKQEFHVGGSWSRLLSLDPVTGQREVLQHDGGRVSVAVPARRTRLLLLLREQATAAGVGAAAGTNGDAAASWDWAQWQKPARDLYPHMRWWWPGNAVQAQELRRELRSLYQAGYGGVELQTLTIGLSQQHLKDHEQTIYGVGTQAYFANLKTVFQLAGELGMSVDLTLGSGWSSGGPFIKAFPEQQLLRTSFDVTGPARITQSLPLPQQPWYARPSNWIIRNTIGKFDRDTQLHAVVAARLDTATTPPSLTELRDISDAVEEGQVTWDVPPGDYRIFAVYQNDTAHNVAASAYPGALAAAPILDHLDPGGAREYIAKLGEPWLAAIAPHQPSAFFVDSFELIGELPWSDHFAERHRQLHGYDVKPYLPLLFMARGESKYVNVVLPAAPAYQSPDELQHRVREDYETTRQQLFIEAFVQPLRQWANSRGIKLRMQAHGGYGDYLDTYQMADIPEAEGLFAGGSFDFLKLAASAGHVAGQRMISSESFITMTTDFNSLDIEDYYLLAGNAYAAGINRTVCHGYAYHYVPLD